MKIITLIGQLLTITPLEMEKEISTKKYKENIMAKKTVSNNTATVSKKDAEDNKGMAIVGYLIFFLPLLTGDHRKSPFVKYHTNQGTLLFFLYVAYAIVYSILLAIFGAIVAGAVMSGSYGALGFFGIVTTLLTILWFVPLILVILGIINAATGKAKPLPVIGRFNVIK
jgi:uncharacterized membrane protein